MSRIHELCREHVEMKKIVNSSNVIGNYKLLKIQRMIKNDMQMSIIFKGYLYLMADNWSVMPHRI